MTTAREYRSRVWKVIVLLLASAALMAWRVRDEPDVARVRAQSAQTAVVGMRTES